MRAFRASFAVSLLCSFSVFVVACAGADNSGTLVEGDGGDALGGASGAAGSVTTQPVGGGGGKGGASGAAGEGGAAGSGGAAGKGGVSGAAGKGGASGASGKGGAAGSGGAAGKGGASGAAGKGGTAGTGGAAGKGGAAGNAGTGGKAGSSTTDPGCDPTDEAADYESARSLGDIDDSTCEQSLEGVIESAGDVDWFTYNGTDSPTIIGCDTKPYAAFLSGQAGKEVCLYAVSGGFGFATTPTCAKGSPADEGPAGDILGTIYGCCDATEVQLDFNTPIVADNATIYIRVTGGDDTCKPYKLVHGYGQ
jgi:hypothetical protein